MLKEFREFALKGNLVDLAVAFIIGAAFSGLVNSLVNDIVMPIIGAGHRRHRLLRDVHPAVRRAAADAGPGA